MGALFFFLLTVCHSLFPGFRRAASPAVLAVVSPAVFHALVQAAAVDSSDVLLAALLDALLDVPEMEDAFDLADRLSSNSWSRSSSFRLTLRISWSASKWIRLSSRSNFLPFPDLDVMIDSSSCLLSIFLFILGLASSLFFLSRFRPYDVLLDAELSVKILLGVPGGCGMYIWGLCSLHTLARRSAVANASSSRCTSI